MNSPIMQRLPLLIPALLWVTGLAAARMDLVSWSLLAGIACVSAFFLFMTRTRKYAVFLLAGIAWGLINLGWDARLAAFDTDWLESMHQITASVVETQHTQIYTRLTLKQITGRRKKGDSSLSSGRKNETASLLLHGRAWLYVYQHAANKIRPGDRIRAQVHWHRPRNHNNPGGFNFAAYCFDRHIALIGSAHGVVTVLTSDVSWLDGIRQRIKNVLHTQPAAQRGIFEALLLADRSHIPIRVQDAFAATGTMHLLAISGLHIGMAGAIGFALCWWLLTRREAWMIKLPVRGLSMIAAMLVAVAYASLAGWPLPTQRATMMLAAGVLAWWLKARAVPVNTLLAALILILLLDAQAVGAVSLWLSFAATASILFWVGKHESHTDGLHIGHAFTAMLWVTLIAGLATLPLIASTFGRLPIYSLPANMLMLPLYSLFILPLALAAAVVAISGFSGAAIGLFSIAGYGIEIGNHLLEWMLQWPGGYWWIPAVPWWLTGFYVSGGLCAAIFFWKNKRWSGLSFMLLTVLIYGMLAVQERFPAQMRLTAWDVGQGAAASLVSPNGHVMVVDAPGRRGSRFNGGTIVAAGLRASGITHVDVLVITHAQSDHMGGMMRLLMQVNHVKELWLADTPDMKHHPFIRRVIERVRLQGGHVRWLQQGDVIDFDDMKIKVLWPPFGMHPPNPNNASLVLSLQLKDGKRLLFPGDIEAKAEAAIVAHGMQTQDIMLMPHHGSTTSSTPVFIQAVMPEIVIAQTGYANRYGFPKLQVIHRYQHAGAQVQNTSHGAVTVLPDEHGKGGIHVAYAVPIRSVKRKYALQWWQQFG